MPAEDRTRTSILKVVPPCVATAGWSWLQAQSFVAGYPASWRGIVAETGRRISLPAYPWQRRDFWFTSNAAEAPRRMPATADAPADAGQPVAQTAGPSPTSS